MEARELEALVLTELEKLDDFRDLNLYTRKTRNGSVEVHAHFSTISSITIGNDETIKNDIIILLHGLEDRIMDIVDSVQSKFDN